MTVFQINCEQELYRTLHKISQNVIVRKVEGIDEKYIKAKINGTSFEIFIYEDEAGIQGSSIDCQFEYPDYESPDELSKAFIEKVIELTIKETEKK